MNKSGRSGTIGETAVVRALRPFFAMAERRAKQGVRDRGDIGGVCPRVVIEVKHCPKDFRISPWLNEADREGLNDDAELAVVWFKIRGTTDALRWPVMMRGDVFVKLLRLWAAQQERPVPEPSEDEQLSLF